MPPGWIHQTIDMIAWGRIHRSAHKRKDRFWRELGTSHRIKEHPLFQEGLIHARQGVPVEEVLNWMFQYAKELTESDWERGLTPDVIETQQAGRVHDCWDLLWDDFTPRERLGIANAFRDVVLRPEAYPNLFEPNGYDVMRRPGPWQTLKEFVRRKKAGELM